MSNWEYPVSTVSERVSTLLYLVLDSERKVLVVSDLVMEAPVDSVRLGYRFQEGETPRKDTC